MGMQSIVHEATEEIVFSLCETEDSQLVPRFTGNKHTSGANKNFKYVHTSICYECKIVHNIVDALFALLL